MNTGAGRLCLAGPGGTKCLDEEEASLFFEEVSRDLGLLGFARREGGGVVIDVGGLVGLAPACYVHARDAYEGTGMLEKFRSDASQNPHFWALATLIHCVESELAARRGYGVAERAAEFDDRHRLVLASLLHAALDKPPYADILTRMFRRVFGV